MHSHLNVKFTYEHKERTVFTVHIATKFTDTIHCFLISPTLNFIRICKRIPKIHRI